MDDRARRIWNTRYAGNEAGCIKQDGYRRVRIDGNTYFAHRLAYAHANGEWPGEYIDHVNGARHDNRLSNIRAANSSENGRNTRICSHNTSGVMGVSFHKGDRKWRAYVKVHGKQKELGSFHTKEDAAAARKAAEPLYGYHPNHGRAA